MIDSNQREENSRDEEQQILQMAAAEMQQDLADTADEFCDECRPIFMGFLKKWFEKP